MQILTAIALTVFCSLTTLSQASTSEEKYRNAFEQSRHWPFHVAITESQLVGEKELKAGTRGVLIRMENPTEVLIDFGRNGIGTIPTGKTDLLERITEIAEGGETSTFPNYIMHIGPRLLTLHGDKLGTFQPKQMLEYAAILTVFTTDDEATLQAISIALESAREDLESLKVIPVLFPMGVRGDAAFSDKLESLGLSTPFVFSNLAEMYARTLQHDYTNLPLFVLNDPAGKVLYKSRGSGEPSTFVKSALEAVPVGQSVADPVK